MNKLELELDEKKVLAGDTASGNHGLCRERRTDR